MFAAPVFDLKKAIQNHDLGTLNPTPWGFMLGNCIGWVMYALMKSDVWIFVGNLPGFLLSVWLNMGAIKLLYEGHHSTELRKSLVTFLQEEAVRDEKNDSETKSPSSKKDWASDFWNVTSQSTPAPTRHENLVMTMVFLWTCIASVIAFARTSISEDTQQLIVGITVNIILVFFYGAPLSTIFRILKDRNTATIHIPTMILNTLNGTFWMSYGFAVNDYFVYVPNALGALLGGVQIILCLVIPRKVNQDETSIGEDDDNCLQSTIEEA